MRLLLGVTGGIAAYKACELVRLAVRGGWSVRVAMTASAARFVGPATFEALAGHPVLLDPFEGAGEGTIDHVAWAKWAAVACVAPLTANTLGRLACGLADDALTTVLMALPAGTPCLLAPAMNTAMWRHPVVRRNLRWIEELGRYHVVPPDEGLLACGDVGPGAMAAPARLWSELQALAGRASA